MAIAFRSVGAQTASAANSIAPALPAGWQPGDFALCFTMTRGNATLNDITTPQTWTGLTQVSKTTSLRARIHWRFLQSGDASPRVTSTASECFLAFIAAFTGVDPSTPFDVPHASSSGTAVNSAMHTPTLTTSKYGDMMVWHFASGDDNCHTTPSCGTAAAQGASYDSTTGADGAQSMYYRRFYTPGAVGSMTAKQNSNGNDDYIAFTLALQAEDPHYANAATDYMFLSERRTAEQLHVFRDGVLFGAQTKTMLWDGLLRDMLFLYDTGATQTGGGGPVEVTRAVTDYLFLFDLRASKIMEKTARDAMLLNDVRMALRELFAARDGLLLRDAAVRGTDRLVQDKLLTFDRRTDATRELRVQDKPLLGDWRKAEQEHRPPADNLFLKDFGARAIEEIRRDFLLTREQAYRETLRAALDKILAAERLSKVHETISRDAALLRDYRGASDQEHRPPADKLFLSDAVAAEKGKFLAFVDGLLLRDDASRDLSRFLGDKLLVKDTRMMVLERRIAEAVLMGDIAVRVLERLIREGLYLADAVDIFRVGVILRHIVDYLFLYDSVAVQTPAQNVLMQDKLLLGDRTLRDITHQLVDALLIKDYRGPSALESTKRDGTLLRDGLVKLHEARKLDMTLLSDAAIFGKDIVRDVLDKLMLLDRRVVERELTVRDVVLLREIITRVRELLARDNLLLPDSAASAWYPYLMEYLVYARTAVLRLLGVESGSRDYMGRHLAFADPLGRSIGAAKWELN